MDSLPLLPHMQHSQEVAEIYPVLVVVTVIVRRKRRRRREEGEVAGEEEVDQHLDVCSSVLESFFADLHSHADSAPQEGRNGPPLAPAPLPPYLDSPCYWEQRGSGLGEGEGAHWRQEVYPHSSGGDLDC